nr:translocation/assembly module TamB domain-containing protein [Gemmatimonadaceae bacterium]
VIDRARVRDGTFLLTMPWHPADSHTGGKRDSSIRDHLARPGGAFHRTASGHFAHTYRWTEANAVVSHARIADPDSVGRLFVVDTASVVESEPPFEFRNAQLTVRHLGDSVWFESRHFATRASTGRARGKVVWGSDLPIRYDARVWADSVSLTDVAWVYPTMPRTGGGRLVLDIRNDRSDLGIIDYRLSSMDVRSVGSRIQGAMTFGVGGPVLVVKDVDVRADPVDFDLIRTFAGAPFPVDWQGTLTGTVQARGGPLTNFIVDRADVTYRDKHVRGATSVFQARGGLNILDPAFTKFLGLRVDVARLDLRTVQHLYPEFPPLGGTVTGVATLDSSWLDVRFRDADVTHRNGPETPSRITGAGRVTYGDDFLVYDLDIIAQPLSLPMMARAYPSLPLTGLVSGPVRARGTTDSLELSTVLTGDAGTLRFDGVVDIYEPEWRARGTGTVAALDVARVFTVDAPPPTQLNGRYDIDMAFLWGGPAMDSLVAIGGRASLDLDRSVFDDLRLRNTTARLRFAGDRMLIDSLRVSGEGVVATARGGIGLAGGPADSIIIRATVDSLGALRQYLASAGIDDATISADTLGGALVVEAVASGQVDRLAVRGTVTGEQLRVGSNAADRALATFDIADVFGARSGSTDVRLLRTSVLGVHSDSLLARVNFDGADGGVVAATLFGGNGPSAQLFASFTRADSLTFVTIDTLGVNAGDHSLALAHPARLVLDTAGGAFLDSLVLRDPHHGTIRLTAVLPAAGEVAADLRVDSIALEDVATVLMLRNVASGTASLTATLRGTRDDPVIRSALDLHAPAWGDMRLDRVTARAAYDSGFARADLDIRRGGRTAIAGAVDLPVALTLSSLTRQPTDSIHGWVAADSADLAIVEAFSAEVDRAQGVIRSRIELAGTWGDPTLDGYVRVAGGSLEVIPLGIRLRELEIDLALVPGSDSIVIRRVAAVSGPSGTVALAGFVSFRDLADPRFDLRLDARGFHVIERSRVAQLDISTGSNGLRLAGRTSGATLTGTVAVDRGTIFIPDTRRKSIVDLTGEDLLAFFDERTVRDRGLVPAAPSRLVENLRLDGVSVQLGDEVWLRSREANVKLGGSLRVTRAVNEIQGGSLATADTVAYRLALAGALNAERGTYRLDLGPVRREFQVESGTITFFGTPDLNPALDIAAVYTVQQYQQEDVRVRARLTGFLLPQPTLVLESASGYALSQSDLISYLVTGRPSVEIGSFTDRGAETATSVLLPTIGTWASGTLRDQLGGWVDQIRFETGTADTDLRTAQEVLEKGLLEAFYTSRLGGEKQIGENWFVALSSGLCQFNPDRQGSGDPELAAFVNQLAWS